MDTEAARRARQKQIKEDLLDAFTDEEACPPDWVDALVDADEAIHDVRRLVERETERFVSEPDVRRALERRERVADQVRERAGEANTKVRRLNLIAPLPRFQRTPLDPEELLRPLYRSRRRPEARGA